MKENEASKAWFCLIPAGNLALAKQERVWGVPDSPKARGPVRRVKPGDVLYFYVTFPTKAILAKSIVASSVFIERNKKAPWTDRFYPFRFKLGPVETLERPIPFSSFVGKISRITNRFGLMGMTIIPLTEKDERLIRYLSIPRDPSKL